MITQDKKDEMKPQTAVTPEETKKVEVTAKDASSKIEAKDAK